MKKLIPNPARRLFMLFAAIPGVALAGGNVIHVDAVASVNAATLADGTVVVAKGRTVAGDGGGGVFNYSKTSIQPADGGTVFAPLTGRGRLLRDGWTVFGYRGRLTNFHFGMDGVSAGDVTAKMQAMATSLVAGEIELTGKFAISRTILFLNKTGVTVKGKAIISGTAATWAFTHGYRGLLTFSGCTDCAVRDGIRIIGVRLSNRAAAEPWEDGDSGIEFLNCTRPKAVKCVVSHTVAWGILAHGCTDALVDQCTIKDVSRQSGVNIAVGGSTGGTVRGCTIENIALYGIESESTRFASGQRYTDNTIRGCLKGIALVSANRDVTASSNVVEDCLYGATVNNLRGYDTNALTLTQNKFRGVWRGIEFAGAKGARALRNTTSCIRVDTYLRASSYHSVLRVLGAKSFSVINQDGTAARFAPGSKILMLGAEYTVVSVLPRVDAVYSKVVDIVFFERLPAGLTEGEMFKRKALASGSVGFINAATGTGLEVSSNEFTGAALAYQLRGIGTVLSLAGNRDNDCGRLFWFDATSNGGYTIKDNVHTGALASFGSGDPLPYVQSGELHTRHAGVEMPPKATSGKSRASHKTSGIDVLVAVAVVITDASTTGTVVCLVNGQNIVICAANDCVASGATRRTAYLKSPIVLAANSVQTVELTDTVGDLVFKAAQITFHSV